MDPGCDPRGWHGVCGQSGLRCSQSDRPRTRAPHGTRTTSLLVEIAGLGSSCEDIRDLFYAATTDAVCNLLGGAFARLYLVNRTAAHVDLAAESNSGATCSPPTSRRHWTTARRLCPAQFLLSTKPARSCTAAELGRDWLSRRFHEPEGPKSPVALVFPMWIGKGDWAQLVIGFTSTFPLLFRQFALPRPFAIRPQHDRPRPRPRQGAVRAAEHRAVLLRVSQPRRHCSLDAVLAEIPPPASASRQSESWFIESMTTNWTPW